MSILKHILEHKAREVRDRKGRRPLRQLQRDLVEVPAPRDFRAALRRGAETAVIAELKKASPSRGVIRPDFRPLEIARAYVDGGAAALSILTDERFFQGSLEILAEVRRAVDLPLLRKDFTIDEYQIYEARAAGADAVLLIVAALDRPRLRDFHALAAELGMAALVEVHTETEAERAVETVDPPLIGVNNRALDSETFATDLRRTERILPYLPGDRVRVSESGIRTRDDVAYLRGLGIDAVLVGEHLMREADPAAALKALRGG
jgi:indole-3-glycerol phosphate synthase